MPLRRDLNQLFLITQLKCVHLTPWHVRPVPGVAFRSFRVNNALELENVALILNRMHSVLFQSLVGLIDLGLSLFRLFHQVFEARAIHILGMVSERLDRAVLKVFGVTSLDIVKAKVFNLRAHDIRLVLRAESLSFRSV